MSWKYTAYIYMRSLNQEQVRKKIEELRIIYGHELSNEIILDYFYYQMVGQMRRRLDEISEKGNCCYSVHLEGTEMTERGCVEGYGSYYEMYQYKLDRME